MLLPKVRNRAKANKNATNLLALPVPPLHRNL